MYFFLKTSKSWFNASNKLPTFDFLFQIWIINFEKWIEKDTGSVPPPSNVEVRVCAEWIWIQMKRSPDDIDVYRTVHHISFHVIVTMYVYPLNIPVAQNE